MHAWRDVLRKVHVWQWKQIYDGQIECKMVKVRIYEGDSAHMMQKDHAWCCWACLVGSEHIWGWECIRRVSSAYMDAALGKFLPISRICGCDLMKGWWKKNECLFVFELFIFDQTSSELEINYVYLKFDIIFFEFDYFTKLNWLIHIQFRFYSFWSKLHLLLICCNPILLSLTC